MSSKMKKSKKSQKKSQKKSNNTIKSINNIMKENGMTPNKLIKNNKSIKKILYCTLGFVIFSIIFISAILYYLIKLKDCNCFQIKNKINYSNINYLIIIESIILFLNIFSFIMILYTINIFNNIKSGGGKSVAPSYLIGLIIYILIYAYFIYYVYKLYENIDKDCECTQSWLRYLLYFQAILMFVGIISQSYTTLNMFF